MLDFLNLLKTIIRYQNQYLKTFDVKSYHKSEKNRSQVVYKKFDNCDKLNYSVKGKKTHIL